MFKLSLLALAGFAASFAAAAPSPYMQRAKSNELPLLVETRGCPVDAATVRQMAESVFNRSQIAALDPTKIEVPLAPPWLSVNVACLGGGVAFRIDVDFIGRLGDDLVRLSLNSYAGLGLAEDKDTAYILGEIEQRVEAAVADYVAANAQPRSQPSAEPDAPTRRRSSRDR
jgi:hypothetical protein